MHPRTTNTLPKTFDVYALSFESAGALALNNEYSGFAVAPAHYIAFAERKHACPCRVIYHLWRFTWHLCRISNSRLSSASTGPISKMTSACSRPATTSASSTASLTRLHALMNGQRRYTSALVGLCRDKVGKASKLCHGKDSLNDQRIELLGSSSLEAISFHLLFP